MTSAPRDLLLQGPDAFISCRSRAAARPPASPIALHGSGGASALGGGPAAPLLPPSPLLDMGGGAASAPQQPQAFRLLGDTRGRL